MTALLGRVHADSSWMSQLYGLSGQPRDPAWLTEAATGVNFLQQNVLAEDLVIYASLPHVYIHAVLAPLRTLKTIEASLLASTYIGTDASWRIEQVWGGGRSSDRVYLAPPICNGSLLYRGEKLIFLREWSGATEVQIEISQKIIHALNVHLVQERGAYCKIDDAGDLENVIKIYHNPNDDQGESVRAVSINRRDFLDYAVLADMGIVFFFDFNRYRSGELDTLSDILRSEYNDPVLTYQAGVRAGSRSHAYGRQIFLPPMSKRQIAKRYQRTRNQPKEYAVFKIVDLTTGKHTEASCNPARLSSYFQPESKLPRTMSPVFFSAEVLHKYKADSAKFELRDRTISCRGSWYLTTYDVNEAGQVHTYIGYLGNLPHREQLYWLSFNKWPKGPVSRRAFLNDFMGEFAEQDPLQAIKHKIECLDRLRPNWWRPRGREMALAVQIPVTTAENEWSDAVLAFDQLLIEGLDQRAWRLIAESTGRPIETKWQSIKLIEEYLIGSGLDEQDAKDAIRSFREVHDLRTVAKGHSARRSKTAAIRQALNNHGSFRRHFEHLASKCDTTLDLVMQKMGTPLE